MGCLCIAVLVAALVVMTSSAEAGWLNDFWAALKETPLFYGPLLFLGIFGALLPIAAVIIRIVDYEKRNKIRSTQGDRRA